MQADDNFEAIYNWPASPMIAQLLYTRALQAAQNQLLYGVVAAVGDAAIASVRRLMFEQHGHVMFQAGTWVRIRQLQPDSAGTKAAAMGSGDNDEASGKVGLEAGSSNAGRVNESTVAAVAPSGPLSAPMSHHITAQESALVAAVPQPAVAAPARIRCIERFKAEYFTWGASEIKWPVAINTYIRPRTTNNPTWDAVLITGSEIILQFTVADHHEVVGKEVQDLLDLLEPNGRFTVRLI